MDTDSTKKVYTTPKLIVYGSMEVITRGNTDGGILDLTLPTIGIKEGDLTSSLSLS